MREIDLPAFAASGPAPAGTRSSAVALLRGMAVLRLPAAMEPAEFAVGREAFLDLVAAGGGRGAVVDCAAVDLMDDADAESVRKLLVAAALVGAAPCLCGLKPGVAAVFAGQGPGFLRGVRIARDLDDALEQAKKRP